MGEGTGSAGWGGSPVPVRVATSARIRARDSRPPTPERAAPPPANPVAELFAARGSEGRSQVIRLLTGGLSAAEVGRRVAVGSLAGGTGVSTVAALLWQAWSTRRIPGVLLDAAGGWRPGLADRIDPVELVGRPQWSDFLGRDDQQLIKEFDAVRAAAGARSLLVCRDRRTPGEFGRSFGASADVAGSIGMAAAVSWPLVIQDLGHGPASHVDQVIEQLGAHHGALRTYSATPPDLVVVVCRFSAVELRDTAEVLRHAVAVAAGDPQAVNPRSRAVIAACGPAGEWSAAVAAAVAVAADAVAGVVRIDHSRALRDRTTHVHRRHLGGGITRLAAAVAATSLQRRGTP